MIEARSLPAWQNLVYSTIGKRVHRHANGLPRSQWLADAHGWLWLRVTLWPCVGQCPFCKAYKVLYGAWADPVGGKMARLCFDCDLDMLVDTSEVDPLGFI